MLRHLCLAALAVFLAGATNVSSANVVIDSFSRTDGPLLDDPVTASPTVVSGFDFVEDVGFFANTGTLLGIAGFNPGESGSLTYDLTSLGLTSQSEVEFDFTVAQPSGSVDYNFFLDGSGTAVASGTLSAGTPAPVRVDVAGLSGANTITLEFINTTAGFQTFQFGAGDGNFTAVPEPTAMLLFPTAVGLVLARRRRSS